MNRVEPIRDKRKIKAIKNLIKGSKNWRDYILFVAGINLGLRIGDLLRLQVKDLYNKDGSIKDRFEIVEQKTGKRNVVRVNSEVKKALEILKEKSSLVNEPDNYIIYNSKDKSKSISRTQAYRRIKKWCGDVGLTNKIGTHTLRKTWGYHAHQSGISIEVIQAKYMHNSTSTTRDYLGIEQKDVSEAYEKVNL